MRYITIIGERPAGGTLEDEVTPVPALPVSFTIPLAQLLSVALTPQYKQSHPKIVVSQSIIAYTTGGTAVNVMKNGAVNDAAKRQQILDAYDKLRRELLDDTVFEIVVTYVET